MSIDMFEHCIKEFKKNHISRVRLYSTSEPTLHPEFDYMVRRLVEERMHVTVSTNGSTLDKNQAVLSMVDHIQLSISGWDKESYELLHPPLVFEETLQRVKDFRGSILDRRTKLFEYVMLEKQPDPVVSINLLVTKRTDIKKFYDTWKPFVDRIDVHYLTGTTRYDGNVFIAMQPDKMKDYFYPYKVDRSRGCMYPFDVICIAFDGRVVLCCEDYNAEIPLGYIYEDISKLGVVTKDVKHLFNSAVMRRVRHDFLFGTPVLCEGCNRFHVAEV